MENLHQCLEETQVRIATQILEHTINQTTTAARVSQTVLGTSGLYCTMNCKAFNASFSLAANTAWPGGLQFNYRRVRAVSRGVLQSVSRAIDCGPPRRFIARRSDQGVPKATRRRRLAPPKHLLGRHIPACACSVHTLIEPY